MTCATCRARSSAAAQSTTAKSDHATGGGVAVQPQDAHGPSIDYWTSRFLQQRQPEAAARLMSFAAHFWQRHFGPLAHSDQPHLRRVRRLVAVQLSAARHDALWAEGAAMPLAQAVALAPQAPQI